MKLRKPKYDSNLESFLGENEDYYIDLELVEHKDMKAWTRPGTSDPFVLREVSEGEYRRLKITQADVVVDFGLNIGMFTTFALKCGAKHVYSYEAETENYELAKMNVELNGVKDKATLHNLAVVGNDDKERYFAINQHKNKGAHSLITKKGREHVTVQCVNINEVVNKFSPSIIKMDIEGGEYEALTALQNYDSIPQLIFEFHHAHLDDMPHHMKYNEILALMRSKFANVDAREDTKGAWVNIVYCWR